MAEACAPSLRDVPREPLEEALKPALWDPQCLSPHER